MEGNLPMLVLRALMTRSGWFAFNHLIQVDSFDNNEYRRLYQHVERLHGATDQDLPISALRADVAIHYSRKPELVEELDLVIDRLERVEEIDQALLEDLVKRFLERSAAYAVAEYVSNHADKPEFSVAAVADLTSRAVEVGERVGRTISDLLTSPLSGAPNNRRSAHSLGIAHQLDRGLRGGVGDGELCVYLAPPSGGKSSLLCRTGASHAARGGRVLHVTLEINTRKVVERYDQCWTGLDRDGLEAPEGASEVQAARARVRAAGGHVWVADWAYLPVSPNDIGALVRRMRGLRCECHDELMAVDMVLVDYMMLMTPDKLPGREMRQKFSELGTEMRRLACNLDVPVVTAWQVNRPGSDALLISRKDVAESWDIVMVADIILGLNQSEEECRNRRMRINTIKQRESQDRGYVELYADLDTMVVRDVTIEDERRLVNAALGTDAVTIHAGAGDGQGDDRQAAPTA